MGRTATPCDPVPFQKLRPANSDLEREKASKLPYLQLVGSLLYLSVMTRPDIAYHMSVLCSMMHDPTAEAHAAALDLLLFVSNTANTTLSFSGSASAPDGPLKHYNSDTSLSPHIERNHGFVAYSDASWHKPDKLGYNMFGYVLYLYGGPISFASKRIKVITQSSAEAEYAAAAYACKEIAFVRKLCDFLGVGLSGPTVLAVDNKAAIEIAQNMGVTGRNKHFEDSIHYFRHLVDHQSVTPVFVSTDKQKADGLTKPLQGGKFTDWCKWIVQR